MEGQPSDSELCDLISVAVVMGAITAANEAIGHYQKWQAARSEVLRQAEKPDETFAEIRRDLLRFGDLTGIAERALTELREGMAICVRLIDSADPRILEQIPFLTGYKARVRLRDKSHYREALDQVESSLRRLLRALDEASELVAKIVPPETRTELVASARASVKEHEAVAIVFAALGDMDTTFASAVEMVDSLAGTAEGYLSALRIDAYGLVDGFREPPQPPEPTESSSGEPPVPA